MLILEHVITSEMLLLLLLLFAAVVLLILRLKFEMALFVLFFVVESNNEDADAIVLGCVVVVDRIDTNR